MRRRVATFVLVLSGPVVGGCGGSPPPPPPAFEEGSVDPECPADGRAGTRAPYCPPVSGPRR